MPGRDLQAGGRLFQWEQQQILLYTERLRSRFLLTGTVIQNQRERKASLLFSTLYPIILILAIIAIELSQCYCRSIVLGNFQTLLSPLYLVFRDIFPADCFIILEYKSFENLTTYESHDSFLEPIKAVC